MANTSNSKGKSNGLHKSYFNGTPAQSKSDHPVSKPPSTPAPRPKGY